jgi:hypothetical protein
VIRVLRRGPRRDTIYRCGRLNGATRAELDTAAQGRPPRRSQSYHFGRLAAICAPARQVTPPASAATRITNYQSLRCQAPAPRRDRLRDTNAAIGTAIVRSSHDPKGTTRNTNAGFDPGGTEIIPP